MSASRTRAVLALAGKDLRLLSRNRATLFFALGWPVLMALFFGYVFGGGGEKGRIPVVVVDEIPLGLFAEIEGPDAAVRALASELGVARHALVLFEQLGGIAALAGGLYAAVFRSFNTQFVQPEESLRIVSIAVVGGVTSVIGALLGSAIDPEVYGLDAAFPAAFVAMLWPLLRERRSARAAGIGAVVCLALIPFTPVGVPILAASLGILVGVPAPKGATR